MYVCMYVYADSLFQPLGKLFDGRRAPDFAIQVLASSGLISSSGLVKWVSDQGLRFGVWV